MSRTPSLPKPTTSFCIDSQTFSLDVLSHHLPPLSPLALSLLKSVTGYQNESGAETSLFIESLGKWQGSLLVSPSAQRLCKGGSSHLYDLILDNPIYPWIQFHTDTPPEKKKKKNTVYQRVLHVGFLVDFFESSGGKESTCNAGDAVVISGSGRSAGEGIGYSLQYSWASLVAQLGKK